MKKALLIIALVASVFGAGSPAVASTSLDATNAEFEFGVTGQTVNDVSQLGGGVAPGDSIHYVAVTTIGSTVIDAVVTYVSGINSEEVIDGAPDIADNLDRLDDDFPDDSADAYLEPILDPNDPSLEARATITVSFYLTGTYTGPGTGTSVTLRNLALNIYDLDESQFFIVEGIRGYSLSTNTHVTPLETSPGAVTFTASPDSTGNLDGTAQTVGRVKVVYASGSTVSFVLGVPPLLGRGLFDLQFGEGSAWSDQIGGGEDTSTLPEPEAEPEPESEPELPETGMAVGILAGLSVAMIAAGAALGARRRLRA